MPTGNPVKVGDRIELGEIVELDFYPQNFKNLSHKLGTVISADDSMIEVEMDEKFPELDEWDNILQFSEGVCGTDDKPGTSQDHFDIYASIKARFEVDTISYEEGEIFLLVTNQLNESPQYSGISVILHPDGSLKDIVWSDDHAEEEVNLHRARIIKVAQEAIEIVEKKITHIRLWAQEIDSDTGSRCVVEIFELEYDYDLTPWQNRVLRYHVRRFCQANDNCEILVSHVYEDGTGVFFQ